MQLSTLRVKGGIAGTCVELREQVVTHSVQLRFSDIDSMGHVNNSRYLSFLEDSRIALLHQIAAEGPKSLIGLILARVEIDYIKPVLLNDEPVEVDVWVSGIGSKSFTLGSVIRQGDAVAAKANAVLVAFDYETQTSRALTDEERQALATRLSD